ncbi:MAG: hypothetical protein LBU88_10985 [Treponema sp.]|jgi:hypothetical protein|nr:hypothetical protein [Treponema sp.]
MGDSVEWQDVKYKETFEQEIRGLTRRRQSDPDCKIEDLEGILRNLYIMDGADQGGRGPLQDIIMAATIAAYEHIISSWKAEIQKNL